MWGPVRDTRRSGKTEGSENCQSFSRTTMEPAATSSSVREGIPSNVSEPDKSIGERTEDSRNSENFSQPLHNFASRISARFSIGPKMLYLLTKERAKGRRCKLVNSKQNHLLITGLLRNIFGKRRNSSWTPRIQWLPIHSIISFI